MKFTKNESDLQNIALKSFFLGPQSENAIWVFKEIKLIFQHWFKWRRSMFNKDGVAISESDQKSKDFQNRRQIVKEHVQLLMTRFENEVPKYSPRYISHMDSEISLPALFGHILTLLHNPNNISEEAARVGAPLEDEAIQALAEMIGFDSQTSKGHFTSGGTIANFEGLWRARYLMDHCLALGTYLTIHNKNTNNKGLFDLAHIGWENLETIMSDTVINEKELKQYSMVAYNPSKVFKSYEQVFKHDFCGPVVLVPNNKHYSWQKGVSLLGLGGEAFWTIELDENGKLCVNDLEKKINKARKEQRPIMMIVSVAGTTEMGEIDPIDKVQDLLDKYKTNDGLHFWHHVDGAYGGFFASLLKGEQSAVLSSNIVKALKALSRINSITIDPHKLGYVPYSCGAIIVNDEQHYRTSSFLAPYISGSKTLKWSRTLEGSRSASGAVATWLTAKTVGLNSDGYGRILEQTIIVKQKLETLLTKEIPDCYITPGDTNVICFCIAQSGEFISQTNKRTLKLFDFFSQKDFYVSRTSLGWESYKKFLICFTQKWSAKKDDTVDHLVLIRLVLMNPFFGSEDTKIDYCQTFIQSLQDFRRCNCELFENKN